MVRVLSGCICCLSFFAGPTVLLGDEGKDKFHPRGLDEIRKTLTALLSSQDKKTDELATALGRLKAYRYLADVPYEDMELDSELNKYCLAASKLCHKLGRLDHNPEKNPGLDDEEFKIGRTGASRSNLAYGFPNLAQAIDEWMDDSDEGNLEHLGHRRWCLFPHMKKVGLGRHEAFTAMYVFDRGRAKVPDYDFVCFPASGYMPVEFFKAKQAWSVSLNPNKFKAPPKDLKPKIYRVDAELKKEGKSLTLDYAAVDPFPFGLPNCLIFRPEKLQPTPGTRYLVEIEGIQRKGKATETLWYLVDFVKWK